VATTRALVLRSLYFFAITIGSAHAQPPPGPTKPPLPTKQELEQLRRYLPEPLEIEKMQNRLAPRNNIHPQFAFQRPPRYGLDRNNDGIVDLPNTSVYVHNLPAWDPSGCPCVNNDCSSGLPQFRVFFTPLQSVFQPLPTIPPRSEGIDPRDFPAAIKSRRLLRNLEWKVEGPNIATITATQLDGVPGKLEACLPEGDYVVTLHAVDKYTDEWAEQKRKITIKDILIVQLGDSYASGEGAPDGQVKPPIIVNSIVGGYHTANEAKARFAESHRYIRWQDDGKPYDMRTEDKTGLLLDAADVQQNLGDPFASASTVTFAVTLPNYDAFSPMHREHYRSHRSSFNATSQLALAVENSTDKSSVTYVNIAMSGATTNQGILGTYEGHKGHFHSSSNLMTGQLAQLQDIVGKREIDVMVISIGGNDAGFSNAAAALVLRDGFDRYLVNFGMIEDAVKTGQWAEIENKASIFQGMVSWSNLLGLNAIPSQYEQIKSDLDRRGIRAKKVLVTQYPFFGKRYYRSFLDVLLNRVGDLGYCEQVLNTFSPDSAPGGREINADELKWARSNILSPLNDKVREGAEKNGWGFVDGLVTLMEPHGLCAGKVPYSYQRYEPSHPVADPQGLLYMRWFRQEDEAAEIENSTLKSATGTIHPNEFGYKAMARRIAEVISWPTIRDEEVLSP
jgi:lysophospholipase L1-like esterase